MVASCTNNLSVATTLWLSAEALAIMYDRSGDPRSRVTRTSCIDVDYPTTYTTEYLPWVDAQRCFVSDINNEWFQRPGAIIGRAGLLTDSRWRCTIYSSRLEPSLSADAARRCSYSVVNQRYSIRPASLLFGAVLNSARFLGGSLARCCPIWHHSCNHLAVLLLLLLLLSHRRHGHSGTVNIPKQRIASSVLA